MANQGALQGDDGVACVEGGGDFFGYAEHGGSLLGKGAHEGLPYGGAGAAYEVGGDLVAAGECEVVGAALYEHEGDVEAAPTQGQQPLDELLAAPAGYHY